MKKFVMVFVFLFCVLANLFAQANNEQVSFKDVPLDIYLLTGFLFVYIVLGLLFLLIFIFYPRQRLNLFFALYNISLTCLMVNIALAPNGSEEIAENLLSRLIGANILLFIVHALDRIKPFFWWFTAFFLLIDFPLTIILNVKYSFLTEIFHVAFTLTSFLMAVVAFRNRKPADWLIGIIAIAVVFVNLRSHLFFFAKIQLGPEAITGIPPFVITVCALIYLALRYSQLNTSLEQQLNQVQVLSKKNLQAEKEKQLILASQNEKLEQQVSQRTAELNNSLSELKAFQSQLIQSEKMASLGELTAGIAHEIQNPLNFVNNFSEVSAEMMDEMEKEFVAGNQDEGIAMVTDIKLNLEKILHHGKRADSIVKGMLQHSRSSTGKKEPTNINVLAEEYLRLAYHGLRAKDKTFDATIETNFDKSIGKIDIISQDIGRVILNLINNAFYAVNEKKQQQLNGYEPAVSVSTIKINDKIEIKVADNGNGVPQNIADKIFQPFFTTKPAGKGTGLGLSLAYDIIKAHGGELKVETKEGEGSEFIIQISTKEFFNT